MRRGRTHFGYWQDAGLLPLKRNGRSGEREVEQVGDLLAENRGSQSPEAGRNFIKSSGCGVEMIKDLKETPF